MRKILVVALAGVVAVGGAATAQAARLHEPAARRAIMRAANQDAALERPAIKGCKRLTTRTIRCTVISNVEEHSVWEEPCFNLPACEAIETSEQETLFRATLVGRRIIVHYQDEGSSLFPTPY